MKESAVLYIHERKIAVMNETEEKTISRKY